MATQETPKTRSTNSRAVIALLLCLGLIATTLGGLAGGLFTPMPASASGAQAGQVEPGAGEWHTWLMESGSQLRPQEPPGKQETKAEILKLIELAGQRDSATLDKIAYWNTGAPVYRWNELTMNEAIQHGMNVFTAGRALALLHAAINDATVATWDAKYAYNRMRPGEFSKSVKPVIETPRSPSYPSEHAAAAGAASEVMAYIFPDRANYYRNQASEAGQLFVIAGIQYPSDVEAGLELGRQVARLAIQRANADGSDTQWDGTMPSGPGYWTGQNPAGVTAGSWKTWALESGSEFRPGPPIPYDSPEKAAEMDELRNFQRTPKSNSLAWFWEWGAGGTRNYWYWNEILNKKALEYHLESNPPRAAQMYAMVSIALYDSVVACFDAKYTYWAIRPFQLDPTFQALFPAPNHPSYPAAHGCLSTAQAEVLANLFPRDASQFIELAEEAREARIWAGIHYRSDILAGQQLGQDVANKIIEVTHSGGSQ